MNRKKIAAIIVFGLTMTTCAAPANGQMYGSLDHLSEPQKTQIASLIEEARIKQAVVEARDARIQVVKNNTKLMNKTVKQLSKTVGKTWYVFSGNTPTGWDCSGLTMWFYEQQGIALEHRATLQSKAGKATKSPKPGDIVVFKYKGYSSAYHVGIYIGDGKMIHAPNKGQRTRVENVSDFGGNYSSISYRTLIETI